MGIWQLQEESGSFRFSQKYRLHLLERRTSTTLPQKFAIVDFSGRQTSGFDYAEFVRWCSAAFLLLPVSFADYDDQRLQNYSMGKIQSDTVVLCCGLCLGVRGNAIGSGLEPGRHRRYQLAADEVWLAGLVGVGFGCICTSSDARADSPRDLGAARSIVRYRRDNLGIERMGIRTAVTSVSRRRQLRAHSNRNRGRGYRKMLT